MSAIRIDGVSKAFGSVRALDEVTLDVAEGELLTLLGPSGCGKTTLLRVVAGLTQLDAGHVEIGGADMTTRSTRERPIGMVFQSYALFPNLTVRGNVCFPLEVRGWTRQRVTARADELLALVRLGGRLTVIRARYLAAKHNAAPLPARWLPTRRCCFWMSRCRRWTSWCGRVSATRSSASSSRWARRRST